jgi:glycosyltransferase involved in cell wall biosynthesis
LILAELDFSKPYGSHTRPFFIGKHLESLGHDLLVLCVKNQKHSFPWIKELQSLKINWPFGYFAMVPEVMSYLKTFKPDVIYVHSNVFAIVAKVSKRLCSQKSSVLILDKHGSWALEQVGSTLYPISVFAEHIALKQADEIIVASEGLKLDLHRIYELPYKKTFVVPNGVEIEVFNSKPQNKVSIKSEYRGKKVLVFPAPRNFVSNLIAIRFMYEVMNELSSRNVNVILLITGGGPIVEPKPLNVFYTGFVDNLSRYLSSADVAVLPYPAAAQCGGARNKVLEYFACSVPVVSTKEGMHGVDDALANEHYILASDSSEDFAEKIILTLKLDNTIRQKMISSAYNLVIANYTWENSAFLVNDLIKLFAMRDRPTKSSKKTE